MAMGGDWWDRENRPQPAQMPQLQVRQDGVPAQMPQLQVRQDGVPAAMPQFQLPAGGPTPAMRPPVDPRQQQFGVSPAEQFMHDPQLAREAADRVDLEQTFQERHDAGADPVVEMFDPQPTGWDNPKEPPKRTIPPSRIQTIKNMAREMAQAGFEAKFIWQEVRKQIGGAYADIAKTEEDQPHRMVSEGWLKQQGFPPGTIAQADPETREVRILHKPPAAMEQIKRKIARGKKLTPGERYLWQEQNKESTLETIRRKRATGRPLTPGEQRLQQENARPNELERIRRKLGAGVVLTESEILIMGLGIPDEFDAEEFMGRIRAANEAAKKRAKTEGALSSLKKSFDDITKPAGLEGARMGKYKTAPRDPTKREVGKVYTHPKDPRKLLRWNGRGWNPAN